ncbi:MAG: 7,8-didemethyl-8-hydroxy-5-deazariboflavin synthase subunit CofH [bacterium]
MNSLTEILFKVTESEYRLTKDDAILLFNCKDKKEIQALKEAADKLRSELTGNKVSYIINLNVNFTNICDIVCLFCGFRRSETDKDSYIINLDEFEERLFNAVKDGISEICLQGGLYSRLKIHGLKSNSLLDIYAELLSWIKDRYPDLHIHAYSPEEIEFLSILSGKSINYILEYFKDLGLDSIPGTAAEILVDEVRSVICPKKLTTNRWREIVTLAHKLNIPTTATIMYGHVESNYHRAKHLEILRNIQDQTNGFTEFIPLSFIAANTPLSKKVDPLKSVDRLKMLAIARLFFKDSIPNIQASWVKQGLEETAESLDWGVNDVGGTLGDERITYAAGGTFGRSISKEQLIDLIKSKNKQPVLRDTLYNYEKELVSA